MTATYWEIGRRIVDFEQAGKTRAAYGARLVERLSADLTGRFGRGFGIVNLTQMRKFYQTWPKPEIVQTVSEELSRGDRAPFVPRFPLSWSHYVRQLSVNKPEGRAFYETEALRGGWTVRQLDRQIGTQFYDARYALEGLTSKVLAAEYRTALPSEKTLAKELERTRGALETRGGGGAK